MSQCGQKVVLKLIFLNLPDRLIGQALVVRGHDDEKCSVIRMQVGVSRLRSTLCLSSFRRESGVDRSSKLAFHIYVRHIRLDVHALFRSKINEAASFCTYMCSPSMISFSVLKLAEASGKIE